MASDGNTGGTGRRGDTGRIGGTGCTGVEPGAGNAVLGKRGEERAVRALQEAGMSIVARNLRCKYGEVDIVAIDNDTLAFIEVKAWSAYGFGELQYSVGAKKQRRIIETAKFFLAEHREYNRMSIRFDVIFISKGSLTHLASAFAESV